MQVAAELVHYMSGQPEQQHQRDCRGNDGHQPTTITQSDEAGPTALRIGGSPRGASPKDRPRHSESSSTRRSRNWVVEHCRYCSLIQRCEQARIVAARLFVVPTTVKDLPLTDPEVSDDNV